MKIVTDSGTDISLSPEQLAELNINIVPLTVTLEGKTYREGVDITPDEFYRLLETTQRFPSTSQPSVGSFSEVYKRIAATDPDIISIHMSSGLSGTFSVAQTAAKLVPEANVTHVDTKTLSAAAGWQVEAAARAIKAGWSKEQTLSLMESIGNASESIYTLKELKYLIHGGRISHLKGIVASLLNIKPLIGVEKKGGTYVQLGRVQVLHAHNPEGASRLRDLVDERFDCTWLPVGHMSLVLGAHTGPSMVGVAYAPIAAFADIP